MRHPTISPFPAADKRSLLALIHYCILRRRDGDFQDRMPPRRKIVPLGQHAIVQHPPKVPRRRIASWRREMA